MRLWILEAQIFVAVLGASNYTYAEATWTQGLADWIGAHTRAFSFFEGVPALLELNDDRHGRRSTLVTSQLLIAHWHAYLVRTRPWLMLCWIVS